MKKILLLFAIAAVAMTAKAYDFCYHGIKINNGDRINITEYWNQTMGYFNPELTLESSVAGAATVRVENIKSTQSPDLQLDEDGFDYIYGIGDPNVSICSLDGQCVNVYPNNSITKSGTVPANEELDLQIELCYTVGLDETSIDDFNIDASFDVIVNMGGETTKATFYVEHSAGASVAGIDADNNAPVQYFDLQGRCISEPTNGIFIKRQGDKVTKVIR